MQVNFKFDFYSTQLNVILGGQIVVMQNIFSLLLNKRTESLLGTYVTIGRMFLTDIFSMQGKLLLICYSDKNKTIDNVLITNILNLFNSVRTGKLELLL